ncbi:hypothetical protein [Streptomyces sp. ST1020]|uniref:hypothetical protein n=1 Tax=Streptomyces sp. ST1020 TaxID=1848901 RepID=UPI0034C6CED5
MIRYTTWRDATLLRLHCAALPARPGAVRRRAHPLFRLHCTAPRLLLGRVPCAVPS